MSDNGCPSRWLSDKGGIDLPSPRPPDVGLTGATLGMGCVGGDDAQRATRLDDGFLKGWLGRTKFGENERYMAAAVDIVEMVVSLIKYDVGMTSTRFHLRLKKLAFFASLSTVIQLTLRTINGDGQVSLLTN